MTLKNRNGKTTCATAAEPRRTDLYFDESGQDTQGKFFIVAGAAVEDSNETRSLCEAIERISGKGSAKWGKADINKRLIYLRAVIADERFRDLTLFSFVFWNTQNYVEATIRGINLAVANLYLSESPVYVYVDALAKAKCNEYKVKLRKRECYVKKVRGIKKDENEPLIRLADAVAGATRDLLDHKDNELKELFSLAIRRDILIGWVDSTTRSPEPQPAMRM